MSRVCVVTGASGGIGAACCDRFAEGGYVVEEADLETGCDVTSERDVHALFQRAAGRGEVTAVVLAHGVAGRGSIEKIDLAEWQRLISVNATGSFLCAREAARTMSTGSIVFISSQAGRKGAADWGAYCASKFAVIGLMESLAQEIAERGIRANAICPGAVDTQMLKDMAVDRDSQRAAIPLGRFAEPSEVAALAAFLCSNDAAYLTGSSIVMDGGELS
jgi:NAD(P)-dependent dehydrogenase (short-subunit alcohol dehydrogenase family)